MPQEHDHRALTTDTAQTLATRRLRHQNALETAPVGALKYSCRQEHCPGLSASRVIPLIGDREQPVRPHRYTTEAQCTHISLYQCPSRCSCLTYILYDVPGWDQTVYAGRFISHNFRVCVIVTPSTGGRSSGSVTTSLDQSFQYVLGTCQGAPALDQLAVSPYLGFSRKRHDVTQPV